MIRENLTLNSAVTEKEGKVDNIVEVTARRKAESQI
jgi:hypothetical protein